MTEVWKDIGGFENLYQVSNHGNIRNLRTGKLLKPSRNAHGYMTVHLSVNGIPKTVCVHRLVAIHFVDNPNKFNVVNHLDCNKQNNKFTNLEWTTAKGNMQHASANGRMKGPKNRMIEFNKDRWKPVIASNGEITLYYPNAREAEKDGFSHSDISRCCNGKRKTHKGFVWKFKEE